MTQRQNIDRRNEPRENARRQRSDRNRVVEPRPAQSESLEVQEQERAPLSDFEPGF
jgi:hypothetical protein